MYLPSPLDIPPVSRAWTSNDPETEIGTRKASDEEPFSALAFKIMADPFVGKLAFFRVYSGALKSGQLCVQLHQGQARAHRPHPGAMHANHREEIEDGLRRRHLPPPWA